MRRQKGSKKADLKRGRQPIHKCEGGFGEWKIEIYKFETIVQWSECLPSAAQFVNLIPIQLRKSANEMGHIHYMHEAIKLVLTYGVQDMI